MARLIEIGTPVNDGEKIVLKRLRDELPTDWTVISNFEVPSGQRMLECDAIAFSPDGWAFLIETKALSGAIVGNDREWSMPHLAGGEPYVIPNPIHVVRNKAKKLATLLKQHDPRLVDLRIFPLIVVVSDIEPQIEGNYAQGVVLERDAVSMVTTDPRPKGQPPLDAGLVRSAVGAVTEHAQPLAPSSRVNAWELLQLVATSDTWEIWEARNTAIGPNAPVARLKRFWLDSLATGEELHKQKLLARRDLDALIRLAGVDGAVPMLSTVEPQENAVSVVTEWPAGPNLASVLEQSPLDLDSSRDLVEALLTAVSSVHEAGIVHRALSPDCVHVLASGRIVLTDFDFARVPGVESITQYLPELSGAYVAPEVRVSPADASLRSDVWSVAVIALRILGALTEDRPPVLADWERVPAKWRGPLRQACEDDPDVRWPNVQVLLNRLRSGPDTAPAAREGFQPNDVLNRQWVVRSHARSGGLADVYRVYDTEIGVDFAAKFLQRKYEEADEINVRDEYKRVADVPPHPNLALPKILVVLTTYRRGQTDFDFQSRFLLTTWVEGESLLDTLLVERLPLARTVEVVSALASGLEHLHHAGLLHRDVKPANVIIKPSGTPVLVDFNIAARIADVGDTAVGTPDYVPPDLSSCGWGPSTDTFMLALTCCEMLAGKRLGKEGAPGWLDETTLAPEVRAVLAEATAAKNRGIDAPSAFASRLSDAVMDLPEAPSTAEPPPHRVPASPNHNPYRDEINRLFSQSRESNAGTRGLDDFARWSYVPTQIDNALRDAILGGHHRLVLITGNAGDGKTAFIQMLEHELMDRGAVHSARDVGNGSTFEQGGRLFTTNWDGSQDEGDDENGAVLDAFFAPFAGDEPEPDPNETRLIAINEGRLLDFVADEERRDRFGALSRSLSRIVEGDYSVSEDWLLVVNLNLRALTLASPSADADIVGATLVRLADERLWADCESCAVRRMCYARANAEQLRDPVLGPRARDRIRQTLDLVRLRRRLHITMRDLRSALAFVVAGNRSCGEIAELVDGDHVSELVAGRLPNSLFGAAAEVAAVGDETATRDRLLRAIAPLDVARSPEPAEDARLWALGSRALPEASRSSSSFERDILERLRLEARTALGETGTLTAFVHGSLRRVQFLEREGTSWTRMFPHQRLPEFEQLLQDVDQEARDRIIRAISYSEGLFNARFDGELAVSLVAEIEGADRSYVKHPADAFDLVVQDDQAAAQYVEYAPDTLVLRLRGHDWIHLDLDLDLYETLGRILDGFVPSREELRGTWLNLRLFKDQVLAVPTDSLLLARDDERFHEIRREADGTRLVMSEAR